MWMNIVEAKWGRGSRDCSTDQNWEIRKHGVGSWKSILQCQKCVLNCTKWQVGLDDKIQLWHDKWCGNERFVSRFLKNFAIAQHKLMFVKNAYNSNMWTVDVSRNLQDWEVNEYVELLQLLAIVHLTTVWRGSFGT